MPYGGSILIQTETVERSEESVKDNQGGHAGPYVMLAVIDSGAGMDEATRQHIFEPFFTTREPGKGTGLGLSITHGIVEQSGGFIEVESEPGRGTAIKVYLPRVAGPVPAEDTPVSPPAPGDGGKVLAVEQAELRKGAAAASRS